MAPVLLLAPGIVGARLMYRLAEAQGWSSPWFWAALQLVPFVNVAAILVLHRRALGILEAKGIRVGFRGAAKADLARLVVSEDGRAMGGRE